MCVCVCHILNKHWGSFSIIPLKLHCLEMWRVCMAIWEYGGLCGGVKGLCGSEGFI